MGFLNRNAPKRPTKQTVVHKTGWTGDSDSEGLFEENLFVALIIGISLLVVAVVGYYMGFGVNLNWFEGQNFWSTAGIIILVIFVPAIAFSTFTGRSDLIAAEAVFILIGFAMVYMANNWDIGSFIDAFSSDWFNLGDFDFNVSTLMTIVFILAIVVALIGGIWSGHPIGAAVMIIICGLGIFVINSTDPANIFYEIGEALQQGTSGVIGHDIGSVFASVGIGGGIGVAGGAAVGAALGSLGFGVGAIPGAIIGGLIGAGLGGGGDWAGWW